MAEVDRAIAAISADCDRKLAAQAAAYESKIDALRAEFTNELKALRALIASASNTNANASSNADAHAHAPAPPGGLALSVAPVAAAPHTVVSDEKAAVSVVSVRTDRNPTGLPVAVPPPADSLSFSMPAPPIGSFLAPLRVVPPIARSSALCTAFVPAGRRPEWNNVMTSAADGLGVLV
jgi:hypothetical protein